MSHIRRIAIDVFHTIFCCNMKKDKLTVTCSMHGRSKGGKVQNFFKKTGHLKSYSKEGKVTLNDSKGNRVWTHEVN
jgi:hypothetical protein